MLTVVSQLVKVLSCLKLHSTFLFLLLYYLVIVLRQLTVQVIAQVGQEDNSVFIFLACDVSALYIADIFVSIYFKQTPSSVEAEFIAEASLQTGFGELEVKLEAVASGVDEYLNCNETRRALVAWEGEGGRALKECNDGGNLLDADWDLTFHIDFQVAQWLEDLGMFILEGLKVIGAAIAEAWDAITNAVEFIWNGIKDLAVAIGGAIAEVFDALGSAVDDLQEDIGRGVQVAASFLRGEATELLGPLGDIAADAIEIIGEGLDFTLDRFGDALDLVSIYGILADII